jgi:hypothetical protein
MKEIDQFLQREAVRDSYIYKLEAKINELMRSTQISDGANNWLGDKPRTQHDQKSEQNSDIRQPTQMNSDNTQVLLSSSNQHTLQLMELRLDFNRQLMELRTEMHRTEVRSMERELQRADRDYYRLSQHSYPHMNTPVAPFPQLWAPHHNTMGTAYSHPMAPGNTDPHVYHYYMGTPVVAMQRPPPGFGGSHGPSTGPNMQRSTGQHTYRRREGHRDLGRRDTGHGRNQYQPGTVSQLSQCPVNQSNAPSRTETQSGQQVAAQQSSVKIHPNSGNTRDDTDKTTQERIIPSDQAVTQNNTDTAPVKRDEGDNTSMGTTRIELVDTQVLNGVTQDSIQVETEAGAEALNIDSATEGTLNVQQRPHQPTTVPKPYDVSGDSGNNQG